MAHHPNSALAYLSNRPMTPALDLALRCLVVVTKWQDNWRSRRALARLDAHGLRDIGLSAAAAEEESRRPFWDSPAHWHVDRPRGRPPVRLSDPRR